ncbi:MAG: peptide chain release factor-like protein, partial [Deltaproteobacteria bacterium]|nr:peptide chain release factor-like protein [Deltaproteobacteria bacterium]
MISFGISPNKHQELEHRMSVLKIFEADIEEKFIHSSGPGGQNVNKTSTCVYLFHKPSEIEIKCQKTRSQILNRYWARRQLCDKLEQILLGEKSKEIQRRE